MQDIIAFRHQMHKHPELSGQEFATQKRIMDFIQQFKPDNVLKIAKTGLAVVFSGKTAGKTLMFRADIDALPIKEENKSIEYQSVNEGIAHLCGHDGHTAVLLALAEKLSVNRPETGKVVLLFQPAEETGQGAKSILEDKIFKKIAPDYVFGFHNLPRFEKNTFFLRKGVFAAASKGLIIKLTGKTAHAAEPEKGINPAFAMAQIIEFLHTHFQKSAQEFTAFATIIYARIGEIAFGTSPGKGEIMLTLRAFDDEAMQKMQEKISSKIKSVCNKEKLRFSITETEVFPALRNDEQLSKRIAGILKKTAIKFQYLPEPFHWSEDFAYYAQNYPAVFMGIGAGKNMPNLHNVRYNFPDEIIEPTAKVLYKIIENFVDKNIQ